MVLPSRSKNELARALKRARLVRARTREDRTGRAKKNLHIQADRPRRRVLEIEADHLIEAQIAAPTHLPEAGEPGLLRQLVYGLAVAIGRLRIDAARDESRDVVSVDRRVCRRMHGAKLQACERRAIVAEATLPEEDGPRRRELDGDSDQKEHRREEDDRRQAAEEIDGSLDDPGRFPRLVSTHEIRVQSRDPESRIIGFPIIRETMERHVD